MQIRICDDDVLFLGTVENKIKKILCELGFSYDMIAYSSSLKMMEKTDFSKVDVVFLDIDMPELDGLEVAGKITEINPDIILIFMTNRDDLVFQAIHFQPFRFVRKTKLEDELQETVAAMAKKIAEGTLLYEFKRKGNTIKIRLKNIYYLEKFLGGIHVNCKDSVENIQGQLAVYEERLAKYGFVRIHSGFLVNMYYVNHITGQKVFMDNGDELSIGRKYLAQTKNMHMVFLRKHNYGNR